MPISGIFQNLNIVNRNVQGPAQTTPVTEGQKENTTSSGALSDLKSGDSVSGQVLSSNGDTVTLKLSDNSTMTAALKGGVSLPEGSQVTFLVSSAQENKLLLNPLFTNMNASPTVETALANAGLPINESNAAMVTTMMEQGMSIGRENLLSMARDINANPDINAATVVKLNQMNLDVNGTNADLLHTYENMEHQIAGAIDDITNSLTGALSGRGGIAAGQTSAFFDGMLQAFSIDSESIAAPFLNKDGMLFVSSADSNASTERLQTGDKAGAVLGAADEGAAFLEGLSKMAGSGESAVYGAMNENVPNASGQVRNDAVLPEQSAKSLPEGTLDVSSLPLSEGEVATSVPKSLLSSFATSLQQLGANEEIVKAFATGNLTTEQALSLLNEMAKEQPEAGKALLSDPMTARLLQNVLEKNWLLKPENAADKAKVEELYQKLSTQSLRMAHVAESFLGKEAALTQSTTVLHQNIDFMNQLNETFTYVQIPLKLEGQNANGDLYVYTNKKHLAEKEGMVSAYLHLDMDHLGPVDCYVTMEEARVATNFKVADDETLDLIEQHLDLLTERLEKKGFSLKPQVSVADASTSVLDEMQRESGRANVPISLTSFDARA